MDINLIGVPMKYGSDIEGVQFGPDRLREFNIIDIFKKNSHNIYDLGNIYVSKVPKIDIYKDHEKMKFLNPVLKINENLAHAVYCSLQTKYFPFVIGGDHSLGMGSIAGAAKHFKEMAVIWVDAHGDINSAESSPTGNIHGMPLAVSMGVGYSTLVNLYFEGQKVKAKNVYILGARDLDPGEVDLIEEIGLNLYTMDDIETKGLERILPEIMNKIKQSEADGLHLSFDIDVLDSKLVPGTGTPVKDGINVNQAKFILDKILKSKLVTSMDFVELNPVLDDEDESTAKICIDLIDYISKLL